MEQAFFTKIRNEIIPHLQQAKEEVVIAMAWFTSGELFHEVLKCLDRNVKVELILLDNAINYMDYAPDFNLFVNAGGQLRIASSSVGFMHHKFCVVDKKVAITGSYNWTYYAETRNVENIVVTDNLNTVDLFVKEFNRLSGLVSLSSSCPRLSWDQIESRNDVDFRELNEEIKIISEIHNKPVRKVFKTKIEVTTTEIIKTPFAKYAIGIQALDGNDNVIFDPFINSGTQLPYRSSEIELFFDSKNMKEFPCLFIFGNPNNKNEWHLIKEVDLMQVAKGTSDENLPVKFSMNLEDNGSLRVDVYCSTSRQKLTISTLDSNFVKYE